MLWIDKETARYRRNRRYSTKCTNSFVDGASRGQGVKGEDPRAACAFVAYEKRKRIAQFARTLGARTNNEAEYEALIMALLVARSGGYTDPVVYSDSKLVVKQVEGLWKCKTPNLVPLLHSVKMLQEDYRFKLVHVDRSFVHEADHLANVCLDKLYGKRKKADD